jgi:hypothetical protein
MLITEEIYIFRNTLYYQNNSCIAVLNLSHRGGIQ